MYDQYGVELGLSLNEYVRKVFLWMTLGLVVAAASGYTLVATSLIRFFFSPISMLVLLGCEMFLVFKLSASLHKLSANTAKVMFIIYSALTGVSIGAVGIAYGLYTVFLAFAYTSILFGSLALIGYTTRLDLTRFSSIFFASLLSLLVVSVFNLFFHLQGLSMVISYLGIILFSLITAYDIQKMKKIYEMAVDSGEEVERYAIFSALDLFLDFINIFLYIVRIIGNKD